MADLKKLLTVEEAEKALKAEAATLIDEAARRIIRVLDDSLETLRTQAAAVTDTDLSTLIERASHLFAKDIEVADGGDLRPVQFNIDDRRGFSTLCSGDTPMFLASVKVLPGKYRVVFALVPRKEPQPKEPSPTMVLAGKRED
jgi:hypothetical protein